MIHIVSGFMRSGTSMLMEACEAGGMRVVKSAIRDLMNDAYSDGPYRPNPSSLYEPDLADMDDPEWTTKHEGCAVKLVAPFVDRLPVYPRGYRVVFMLRDPEEIRQSYEGAFGQRPQLERIERTIARAQAKLINRKDVLEMYALEYRDVLSNPRLFLAGLCWPLDVDRAAAVVDPAKHRFRREALAVGI